MQRLKRSTAVPALVLIAATAFAQDNASAPASACEGSAGFDDFDFWVGEWDVYSTDGQERLLGHNRITKHYGDCLVLEEWESAGGGGGMSINYYNGVTGEWRQVWVSDGYAIDYTGGLDADGAMVLEGQLYDYRRDTSSGFRGTWTPQDDGTVLQHFDILNSGSDTWTTWFDGLYVPSNDAT